MNIDTRYKLEIKGRARGGCLLQAVHAYNVDVVWHPDPKDDYNNSHQGISPLPGVVQMEPIICLCVFLFSCVFCLFFSSFVLTFDEGFMFITQIYIYMPIHIYTHVGPCTFMHRLHTYAHAPGYTYIWLHHAAGVHQSDTIRQIQWIVSPRTCQLFNVWSKGNTSEYVSGINNVIQREKILLEMEKEKVDIVYLQESHLKKTGTWKIKEFSYRALSLRYSW